MHGSAVVRMYDLWPTVLGSTPSQATWANCSCMCPSPSSIIWYWKGWLCSTAGKITIGMASPWPHVMNTYGSNGHFPSKNDTAWLPCFFPNWLWTVVSKTFHILLSSISPCLVWMSPSPICFNLHNCTTFDVNCAIFSFPYVQTITVYPCYGPSIKYVHKNFVVFHTLPLSAFSTTTSRNLRMSAAPWSWAKAT